MLEKDILRELQFKELECVMEIKRICEKHNLKWMLAFGSVLGAVRHKGFIPWDDDMDIFMFESDFHKFVDLCKTELDKENFFLQTIDTDENCTCMGAKVRMNDTCSMERVHKDIKMHWGICVDIFVLRYAPARKINRIKLKLVWKICNIFLRSSFFNIVNIKNPIKRKIKQIIKEKRNLNLLHRMLNKMSVLCENSDKKEMWVDEENRYYPREIFESTILLDFEGEKLPCPVLVNQYLELTYGDYMKFPPEEERGGHGDIIIDTKKSYLEYQ